MCGIAGFHLKDPGCVTNHDKMEEFANLLLTGIEQRGKQATGFVAVTNDAKTVEVDKRAVNATDFIKERKPLPKGTRTLLAHTRWATQGSNDNIRNIHPVMYGSCFAIHNGSIDNDRELFASERLEPHAEVDTEIVPALIDKLGWDNAAKALSKIQGSFAIAAIDPVRHPNKLLLAKGPYSPLYLYENENFLVWASLGYTIIDAWKHVLGTPPAFNKLLNFTEGDMLYIDGSDVSPEEFKVAQRPFVGSRNTSNGSRNTSATSSRSPGSGQFPRHSTRGVIVDRSKEVADLRAAGLAVARTWDSVQNDKDRETLFQEVPGAIVWAKCYGCKEYVLEDDFTHITGEGKVCVDCKIVATDGQTFTIDEDTKATLEKWAGKEGEAHRAALGVVAEDTGLSEDVIDYLIFRVSSKYTDSHANIAEIAGVLDDRYQKAVTEAFNALLDEHNDDALTLDDEFARAVEADDKPDNATSKCDKCGRFKMKSFPCRPCSIDERAKQGQKESLPADKSMRALTKCWCGNDSEVFLGRIAGFCKPHYEFCNIDDCPFGYHDGGTRVEGAGKANHLSKDGKRICHFHARGQKEVWSDTHIKRYGVIVQEVVPVREPGGL